MTQVTGTGHIGTQTQSSIASSSCSVSVIDDHSRSTKLGEPNNRFLSLPAECDLPVDQNILWSRTFCDVIITGMYVRQS